MSTLMKTIVFLIFLLTLSKNIHSSSLKEIYWDDSSCTILSQENTRRVKVSNLGISRYDGEIERYDHRKGDSIVNFYRILTDIEDIFSKLGYDITPDVYMYDDSKNKIGNAIARADNIIPNNSNRQGTIFLGKKLLNFISKKSITSPWGHDASWGGLGLVLFHEYAHLLQAQEKIWIPGKPRDSLFIELHADFIAGYVGGAYNMHGTLNQAQKLHDQGGHMIEVLSLINEHSHIITREQEFAKRLIFDDLGDLNFNNSTHHGTNRQRHFAYKAGLELALLNFYTYINKYGFNLGYKMFMQESIPIKESIVYIKEIKKNNYTRVKNVSKILTSLGY